MSIIPKIQSKKMKITSIEDQTTMSYKKLPAKNIISNIQTSVIIDPIDPKRISKTSRNSLSISSTVKAALVFAGTIGLYYLTKTTGIFSYFGWGEKTKNSKDVGSREIMEVKIRENALSVGKKLETARQVNGQFVNQIEQTYKTEERTVKFRSIEGRRFISIQNSLPDLN
jgi:hypothetical protein